tara:strand:- start:5393 stop:6376 length:984 start_codon:yes stop_codon:yes gene_type:complete
VVGEFVGGVSDKHPEETAAGAVRDGVWSVVGASGFVGSAIVSELCSRGIEVRRVTAPRLELQPTNSRHSDVVERAHKELPSELIRALSGSQVVINAAGIAEPRAARSARLLGANGLLPTVVGLAADAAGADRYLHISSAAVQGRRPILDESPSVSPFSPYSLSKAIGEQALLSCIDQMKIPTVIVRATSVQGVGRETTVRLQSISRSVLASVARPGSQPSAVSSIAELVRLVVDLGEMEGAMPQIVLQPWEGLSVTQVLVACSGRDPVRLPRWICRMTIAAGYGAGRVLPRIRGRVRQLEMMWLGQRQVDGWASARGSREVMVALTS